MTGKFSPFIDDNINGFWEYLPRNYVTDAPKRYPLLIFIHGSGEQGSVQDMTTLNLVLRNGPPKLIQAGTFPDSFSVNGSWYKFIVICPQIKNGLYGATSIIAPSAIDNLIQYAKGAYRIDTTRIYMCGLSMGGGATWDYAGSSLTAANKLAAIVVACGAGDVSTAEGINIGQANLPVLATHNWDDPLVACVRTYYSIDTVIAGNPSIHPVPREIFWATGGHNAWSRTFEKIAAGSYTGGNVTDTLGMNVYKWMLQFNRLQAALPVSWQSVSVQKRGEQIVVNWILDNQEQVKKFQVQRSLDIRNWLVISEIIPVNEHHNVQYNYSDLSAPAGKLYYRILAIDNDGATDYSPIKDINDDRSGNRVTVYPNPFANQLSISVSSMNENTVIVRIADESGKIISNKQVAANNHTVMVDGSENLPAGLYCVSVLAKGKQVYRQTVLKQ